MTVLSDAFQARYSTQRVLEWTNPGEPDATSVDTTRLLAACSDTEADFKTYTATAFDSTNAEGLLAQQLPAAFVGVRAYLLSYLDQGAGDKAIAEYHSRLKDVAKVTGRDRILPSTNSNLIPTPVPRVAGRIARPDFDDSVFGGQQLAPPGQRASSDPDWDTNED